MSCNYAEGLSPYADKGKLGLPEKWDKEDEVKAKVKTLAAWIRASPHTVVHTGAGISTSAGIPDFRGPKGVWTLEKKGLKPKISLSWDDAKPTKTHMAIAELVRREKANFVISQNIDGLHSRSGINRAILAELHGNMFVDQCNVCSKQFVRSTAASTVGQKVSNVSCPAPKGNGRACRGKLADFVLDWEDNLPDYDLDLSLSHSTLAHLSIVMGSTLQIIPAGNLPTFARKYHGEGVGRMVILNLQPTKHDKKADLIIHEYVDKVMEMLFEELGFEIPAYDPELDPTKRVKDIEDGNLKGQKYVEWTQSEEEMKLWMAKRDKFEDVWKMEKRLERKRKKEAIEEKPEIKDEDIKEETTNVEVKQDDTCDEENGKTLVKEEASSVEGGKDEDTNPSNLQPSSDNELQSDEKPESVTNNESESLTS